jgi:hypothetical protein
MHWRKSKCPSTIWWIHWEQIYSEIQQGAFTPLTDSHGRELSTHELSYAPALPEYPKTDVDGFAYVISVPPEKRGSEKDTLDIIQHVCTAPSLSFSS